jgi:hypothetical protein
LALKKIASTILVILKDRIAHGASALFILVWTNQKENSKEKYGVAKIVIGFIGLR